MARNNTKDSGGGSSENRSMSGILILLVLLFSMHIWYNSDPAGYSMAMHSIGMVKQ